MFKEESLAEQGRQKKDKVERAMKSRLRWALEQQIALLMISGAILIYLTLQTTVNEY